MELAVPEFDRISRSTMGSGRAKKLKILVVDDEPDNLDLLYRTFRRDFDVLRAESGATALRLLEEEGEVAVIISDQRMPEMKGTEFLSRTVPQFPNTMRIILTGFTDIEDLVDAINAGQVYKYITKPWDPLELRNVVQRAAETYQICQQRSDELRRAQAQTLLFSTIAQATLQKQLESLLPALVRAFAEAFDVDGGILQTITSNRATPLTVAYGDSEIGTVPLEQDPLAQDAIATRTIQLCADVSRDPRLSQPSTAGNYQSYCMVPFLFRDRVIAILGLQWQQPRSLSDDEIHLLNLSAQQAAMAIACCSNL